MSASLLSYAGWYILPRLATGWLQYLYYGITIRAGDPKPAPGSVKYIKHQRNIFILVIAAYLFYTIYEADWVIRRQGDYYQDLGVPQSVDEKALQSRFRKLTILHHPDKQAASGAGPLSDSFFVHLKQARDILLDPAKRYAYDRLGPDIVKWQNCATVYEYVMAGVQRVTPFYIGSALFISITSAFGYIDSGNYWRYLTLACALIFEIHTITRPEYPFIVAKVLNPLLKSCTNHPHLLPFQTIILVRKLAVTVFIAISQLRPVLIPPETEESRLKHQMARLEKIAQTADGEATLLLATDMSPFAGDPTSLGDVKLKLKEWLVQNTIRADPEVRNAVGEVLKRKSANGPAGVRGML